MAPPALQRAALEEDGRPNPGSVMDCIFLDVEYVTPRHSNTIPKLSAKSNFLIYENFLQYKRQAVTFRDIDLY